MNIATLDWIVIGVYFVIITAIGLVVGYRVRQTCEYFLGGRRFGPWLMMGQSFGSRSRYRIRTAALGSPVGGGAMSVMAGGPSTSRKIGFNASAQIW